MLELLKEQLNAGIKRKNPLMKHKLYVFFFGLGREKAEVQLPDQLPCIFGGLSRHQTHIPRQKSHPSANAWL